MITAQKAKEKAENENIVFQQMINWINNDIEEKSSYGEFLMTFRFSNLTQMRLKSKIITHLEYHGYNVIDRDEHLIVEWY